MTHRRLERPHRELVVKKGEVNCRQKNRSASSFKEKERLSVFFCPLWHLRFLLAGSLGSLASLMLPACLGSVEQRLSFSLYSLMSGSVSVVVNLDLI
jgi:hypothetical protein